MKMKSFIIIEIFEMYMKINTCSTYHNHVLNRIDFFRFSVFCLSLREMWTKMSYFSSTLYQTVSFSEEVLKSLLFYDDDGGLIFYCFSSRRFSWKMKSIQMTVSIHWRPRGKLLFFDFNRKFAMPQLRRY